MRILVVDDSPTAAGYLRKKLAELGHHVTAANHGREAWDLLQTEYFPLVITDWMMPQMNGPDLIRHVRARGGVPYTYMVLQTVKDLRKDRLEGLQCGADDFLTKPVDTIELVTTLATAGRIIAAQDELLRRVAELESAAAAAAVEV